MSQLCVPMTSQDGTVNVAMDSQHLVSDKLILRFLLVDLTHDKLPNKLDVLLVPG